MLLYSDLNEVEKRIIDDMVKHGGWTQEEALAQLERDLLDAAEEDGMG